MILIQAGHVAIESNCDPGLHGGTGAAGERELTLAIGQRLVSRLLALGKDAKLVNANANCDPAIYGQPYEAAIALHCQASLPGTYDGFDFGVMQPSQDLAASQSRTLMLTMADAYARATGLTQRPLDITEDSAGDNEWCHHNPNVQSYYLWHMLTATTPCVLIEMGLVPWVGQHMENVLNGLVWGLTGNPVSNPVTMVTGDPQAEALTNIGQAIVWAGNIKEDATGNTQDIATTAQAVIDALHRAKLLLSGAE